MTSMEKLLQEKNCYLRDRVQDWRETVYITCELLVEQDYCTTAYKAAIYEITKGLGPYYVFYGNLALIHANSQLGANDTQMAVTVFKESMKFKLDGCDVRTLVALVAKNSESYMEGIQTVSNIFSDEKKVQGTLDATYPKEVFGLFVSNTCEKQR